MRTPAKIPLRRVLVIEDDVELCEEVASVARSWGTEAFEAHSLEEALGLLDRCPDLVIADLWLHGTSAIPLLHHAVHRHPAPAIVAMSGQASPGETFVLGRLNVRAYLAKPFSAATLEEHVEKALCERPDVVPWHQSLVGHDSLKGAQRELRGTMLDEALARHRGSRSGAAKTLDVSRQAIQQVLQREPRQSKKPPQSGDGAPRS